MGPSQFTHLSNVPFLSLPFLLEGVQTLVFKTFFFFFFPEKLLSNQIEKLLYLERPGHFLQTQD